MSADTIGHDGEPVFALSFPGGVFDTVVQLGVVHALLTSGRRAPDVVAGISVGAINATALAEILQEPTPERQVARFRAFLNAYRAAPGTFARNLMPDPYEVDAQAPLKSLELPLHAPRDREARRRAVASTSGVIRLANDLLSLNVTVGTFTSVVRRWLGFRAAGICRSSRGSGPGSRSGC